MVTGIGAARPKEPTLASANIRESVFHPDGDMQSWLGSAGSGFNLRHLKCLA